MNNSIAVLLTCFNRREKTISCLDALFKSQLPAQFAMSVFLVDDGSTDGTSEAVKSNFPQVHLIEGTGSLFWNQGMRLAWENASEKSEHDFFIWLNDDTILAEYAITDLYECYKEVLENYNRHAIITGACKIAGDKNEFSYGGRTDEGPVIPNGRLQQCKFINGNIVLIPKAVFKTIGNLSPDYTHGMGDFDYGLRAIQKGFECFTTKRHVAVCAKNPAIQGWHNPDISLKKRWQLLHSPNGLNLKEYNTFRRKFWKKTWIIFAIKAYAKSLFPRVYNKINYS